MPGRHHERVLLVNHGIGSFGEIWGTCYYKAYLVNIGLISSRDN
ncbi:MAG TPA: hypothetical protein VJJ81_03115 [Candidatus Babeliales bacterium]|nr:hypothetical protein [Candidatus Babeliales bacterium]